MTLDDVNVEMSRRSGDMSADDWRDFWSMPATSATIRALVKSALTRAKDLFRLNRLYIWDRTPERILIGVAARVYAETSGACCEKEFKRWIGDFANFEKDLS